MDSRIWRASVVAVLVAASVTGCNLIKKLRGGDTGDAAPEVTTPADAATADPSASADGKQDKPEPAEAANSVEIKRYPDETKTDHVPLTITWLAGDVYTEAGGGKLIGNLKQKTNVKKIAEKDAFFLVLYDDPSDSVVKLMGWVNNRVFTPPIDAGRPHLNCAGTPGVGGKPTHAFVGEAYDHCEVVCDDASNPCPTGYACNGDGSLSSNGANTRYCITAPPPIDAGTTPTAVDASVAAVDASALPEADASMPGPVDAGRACLAIHTGPGRLGVCPAGYHVGGAGGACLLICSTSADCCFTPGATCQPFAGSSVCR